MIDRYVFFLLWIPAVTECASQKTNQVPSILLNSTVHNDNNSTVQLYPRFYHLNTDENWQEKRIEIRQQQQQKGPCSCSGLNCGCCAGMRFRRFKRICKSNTRIFSMKKCGVIQCCFFSLFQFHIRPK